MLNHGKRKLLPEEKEQRFFHKIFKDYQTTSTSTAKNLNYLSDLSIKHDRHRQHQHRAVTSSSQYRHYEEWKEEGREESEDLTVLKESMKKKRELKMILSGLGGAGVAEKFSRKNIESVVRPSNMSSITGSSAVRVFKPKEPKVIIQQEENVVYPTSPVKTKEINVEFCDSPEKEDNEYKQIRLISALTETPAPRLDSKDQLESESRTITGVISPQPKHIRIHSSPSSPNFPRNYLSPTHNNLIHRQNSRSSLHLDRADHEHSNFVIKEESKGQSISPKENSKKKVGSSRHLQPVQSSPKLTVKRPSKLNLKLSSPVAHAPGSLSVSRSKDPQDPGSPGSAVRAEALLKEIDRQMFGKNRVIKRLNEYLKNNTNISETLLDYKDKLIEFHFQQIMEKLNNKMDNLDLKEIFEKMQDDGLDPKATVQEKKEMVAAFLLGFSSNQRYRKFGANLKSYLTNKEGARASNKIGMLQGLFSVSELWDPSLTRNIMRQGDYEKIKEDFIQEFKLQKENEKI
jgi:hypothetical protein